VGGTGRQVALAAVARLAVAVSAPQRAREPPAEAEAALLAGRTGGPAGAAMLARGGEVDLATVARVAVAITGGQDAGQGLALARPSHTRLANRASLATTAAVCHVVGEADAGAAAENSAEAASAVAERAAVPEGTTRSALAAVGWIVGRVDLAAIGRVCVAVGRAASTAVVSHAESALATFVYPAHQVAGRAVERIGEQAHLAGVGRVEVAVAAAGLALEGGLAVTRHAQAMAHRATTSAVLEVRLQIDAELATAGGS